MISGEDISLLKINELENMKKFIDNNSFEEVKYKIIIFVRNPATMLASVISTIIRMGNPLFSDEKYFQEIKNMYVSFSKFVKIFGKDSVEVYSFDEASKYKNGVSQFFLEKLGLEINIKDFNYINLNESISAEAISLCAYINKKYPMYDGKDIRVGREKMDLVPLNKIKGSKLVIEDSRIKALLDYISVELVYLKNEFSIDYTKEIEYISTQKNLEYYYDEKTVLEAFRASTELVKQSMIDYYSLKNKGLVVKFKEVIVENN